VRTEADPPVLGPPELEDIGGRAPLDFDEDAAILIAASAALETFALRETGERFARLCLLSGYLRGMAARPPKAHP
jgi:hypothetical protein